MSGIVVRPCQESKSLSDRIGTGEPAARIVLSASMDSEETQHRLQQQAPGWMALPPELSNEIATLVFRPPPPIPILVVQPHGYPYPCIWLAMASINHIHRRALTQLSQPIRTQTLGMYYGTRAFRLDVKRCRGLLDLRTEQWLASLSDTRGAFANIRSRRNELARQASDRSQTGSSACSGRRDAMLLLR